MVAIFGLLMIIGSVWTIYWLYRLFPFLYIVLDKKLGPMDAFRYSMQITRKRFGPLLILIIYVGILYKIGSLLPMGAGQLVVWPVVFLTAIHAYKQLDNHYQETAGEPKGSGP